MPKLGSDQRLRDSTYIELVRSLFNTLLPSVIMGALFLVTAVVCAARTPDLRLASLAVVGSALALVRPLILVKFRSAISRKSLDLDSARRAERMFAAIYLAFALVVGAYCSAALALCPIYDHVVVAALIVGFGAGVAAGVALRPWIGIPALVAGVAPSICVSLALGDTIHLLLAVQLAALSAGAVKSILVRYRQAVQLMEMRQLFASLANRDRLTGIGNRLALENAFASAIADFGPGGIVVHLLDLDKFKPVNDLYGHAVGDILLKAVAGRLERLVRQGDSAVRIGGDEFAILQTNVGHPDESELMARRIAQRIVEPYVVAGHSIRIGVCVGSATGQQHGSDLDHLLDVADHALYDAKRRGRLSAVAR